MRIFLTGGTGFIGSHFTKKALSAGHEITSVRRHLSNRPILASNDQLRWIIKDLDEIELHDLSGIDIVVHLAAHTPNPPYAKLSECLHWNVIVPLRLLELALDTGIKRFVVAGSCFEYGLSGERYQFIPAWAPLEPTLSYPASKAAASIAFVQWAIENNVSLSIMRLFQVYGDGELSTRLWPSLCRAALEGKDFPMTKGEQIRDFINVDKVASALLAEAEAMNHGHLMGVSVSNFGSGSPTSILDFCELIWKQLNARGTLLPGAYPYRKGEIMRFVPKIERHMYTSDV